MCEAVDETASRKCYAVDTWRGDPQAGNYDEAVFADVSKYNEETYGAFSKLLRMTFDDAREQFDDETVDLLHIDGLHTYDAVLHDFENWLPTVRPGGIVLMHDTFARHADFQVWRLWEDLRVDSTRLSSLTTGASASSSSLAARLMNRTSQRASSRHCLANRPSCGIDYSLQATALERSHSLSAAAPTGFAEIAEKDAHIGKLDATLVEFKEALAKKDFFFFLRTLGSWMTRSSSSRTRLVRRTLISRNWISISSKSFRVCKRRKGRSPKKKRACSISRRTRTLPWRAQEPTLRSRSNTSRD